MQSSQNRWAHFVVINVFFNSPKQIEQLNDSKNLVNFWKQKKNKFINKNIQVWNHNYI